MLMQTSVLRLKVTQIPMLNQTLILAPTLIPSQMVNRSQVRILNLIQREREQLRVMLQPQSRSVRRSVRKKNQARARRARANAISHRKLPSHLLCLVKGSGFRIEEELFPRKFRINLENNDIENCIANLILSINILTYDT
jgi:hypothetical protein